MAEVRAANVKPVPMDEVIVETSQRLRVIQNNPPPHLHTHPKPFAFLGLPLEIRRHIYETTLGLAARDQISLLCASRKIHAEGREFIYRRPLTCSSQSNLFTFVKEHESEVLEKITTLRLGMAELEPTVMQSYLSQLVMGWLVKQNQHPYLQESQRIIACLQRLPNIRHLSLLPSRGHQKPPAPKDLVDYVLAWAAMHYRELKVLALYFDLVSLDFLSDFAKLQSIRFSGFSQNDSDKAVLMMSGLRSLQELIIVGPAEEVRWRQKYGYAPKGAQSVMPDVLRHTKPLKSLTILDLTESTCVGPAFLTESMLIAIYDIHRDTIRELSISSTVKPEAHILAFLSALILNLSELRYLHVEWPCIETDFLNCLPTSVQHLTVAVKSRIEAHIIIERLALATHRLPRLRSLRFNLINLVDQVEVDGEKQPISFAMPIQASECKLRSPWRTTWGVWQP